MNDQVRTAERPGEPADDSRAAALLRRAGVVEQPPPPHVWEGIVAALRAADGSPRGASGPAGSSGSSGASAPGQPPADLARHRARRSRTPARGLLLPVLAAAAAGALVTWAGLELTTGGEAGQVVARGQLAPLVDAQPAGSAQVVEVDGHQRLRVELDGAPQAGDGYLEVWLLKPDVSGMITLGVLDGEAGEYLLPAGLDFAEYPVVDISREHMDGDPGHGGDSVVRGEVG